MSHRTPTVAVILSDPVERERLATIYAGARWPTRTACNATEGVALVRRYRMDLVVCDYSFPGGSWRDILAVTGTRATDCPVIVLSRLADEHMWAEVLNLGGFDVLAKPFAPEDVLRISSYASRAACPDRPMLPAHAVALHTPFSLAPAVD